MLTPTSEGGKEIENKILAKNENETGHRNELIKTVGRRMNLERRENLRVHEVAQLNGNSTKI